MYQGHGLYFAGIFGETIKTKAPFDLMFRVSDSSSVKHLTYRHGHWSTAGTATVAREAATRWPCDGNHGDEFVLCASGSMISHIIVVRVKSVIEGNEVGVGER